MSRTRRFEAFYPDSRTKVWTALTDPKAVAEWMMANDFRPKVGHRFHFRVDPQPGFNGEIACEVKVWEPPHRLLDLGKARFRKRRRRWLRARGRSEPASSYSSRLAGFSNWLGIVSAVYVRARISGPQRVVLRNDWRQGKQATLMDWTLHERDDGTELVLEHSGFTGVGGGPGEHRSGWIHRQRCLRRSPK